MSDGEGIINFEGGATINNDIGTTTNRLSKISFSANDHEKIVNLNGNMYAKDLELSKAKYQPSINVTLDATNLITLDNPIFDLGDNTIIFKGEVSTNGNSEVIINTTYGNPP